MNSHKASASKRDGLPLDAQMFAVVALPALAIALIFSAWLGVRSLDQFRAERQQDLRDALARLSSGPPAVWDPSTLRDLRNAHPAWSYLESRSIGGATLRSGSPPAGPLGQLLRGPAAQLELADGRIISVATAPLPQHAGFAHIRRALLKTGGLGCLLAGLLSGLAYCMLRRRQRDLMDWAARVDSGQLSPIPPGCGPLAEVAAVIVRLHESLRENLRKQQQSADRASRLGKERLAKQETRLRALESERQNVNQLLASRSELMSSMSHELRTPLTAIMGFSDLLGKTQLDREQDEYVRTIRKSAQGLVGMINDLLDWNRIEAGRLDIHEVSFDISDSVEDTLVMLAPLAYDKGLELISIVYHDVPQRLRGDPVRVQQILTNLLSNAIKFTERGEVVVRVMKDRDSDREALIRFQIEDTGVGISKAQQAQLFQAFSRFESDTKQPIEGSGLGLTIVKKLTELMRGRVELDSEPDRGSTFSVVLPLAKPLHPSPARPPWDALRGIRCWLLEPHKMVRLSLKHVLEFWGVDCREFDSIEQLQRSLADARIGTLPDLVILGIKADDSDDPSVAAVLGLKRVDKPPLCCLVNTVEAIRQRALREAGADLVLPKAIPRTSLYRGLYEMLGTTTQHIEPGLALADYSVLIAENNRASQRYLQALVNGLGAQAICADRGSQALDIWRKTPTDLVLLDLHMPGMDGRQTASAIRRDPRSGKSVLVGMSAYLLPDEERAWRDAGIDTILVKPFDETQLLRGLDPWLRAGKPAVAASRPANVDKLVKDPEMVIMIREELPRQLQELDQAYVAGDIVASRNAAHQLHGTAAFFHLQPLKDIVLRMEKRLKEIDDVNANSLLRDDMSAVRKAVDGSLAALHETSPA